MLGTDLIANHLADAQAALFDKIGVRQALVLGHLPGGGEALAEDPSRWGGRGSHGFGVGPRDAERRVGPVRAVVIGAIEPVGGAQDEGFHASDVEVHGLGPHAAAHQWAGPDDLAIGFDDELDAALFRFGIAIIINAHLGHEAGAAALKVKIHDARTTGA